MRVLFTTFAAKTHMYALVPLAQALRSAGHEVLVASQPDLVEEIVRTGLTAVAVGEPSGLAEGLRQVEEELDGARESDVGMDMGETDPARLTWDYVLNVFTAMTSFAFQNNCPEPMVDDLVAFARSWRPDLVVWDTMTFAGPVAAEASGAAHARLLYGVDLVGRMRRTFLRMLDERPPGRRDDPLAEWLGWSAERHGCAFDESMVTGHFSIDQTPPFLRAPLGLPAVPVRYVPYNGPAVVPSWLKEPPKAPRVCLTLGLMRREMLGADRASAGELLNALAGLDVEVVATLNADQLRTLPAVPDNVRAVDFVPLNALLPSCSAVIHHGGSGTLTTACLHGIPQLVVPHMIWDSAETARRLVERGAGLALWDGGDFSANDLKGGLERLLGEPSFGREAGRIRREILATPAPAGIVPVLERLTAEHRPAR
ncbi:activator-dependent family glycosyltransferase [Spirillospora sp. NPDC047279]|uniref:activator-dependent family glycosyltransferase n=1 Tax=Spirillospora sp. NPDC047279 TaxID=3155478 RepID=UPI0033CAD936